MFHTEIQTAFILWPFECNYIKKNNIIMIPLSIYIQNIKWTNIIKLYSKVFEFQLFMYIYIHITMAFVYAVLILSFSKYHFDLIKIKWYDII